MKINLDDRNKKRRSINIRCLCFFYFMSEQDEEERKKIVAGQHFEKQQVPREAPPPKGPAVTTRLTQSPTSDVTHPSLSLIILLPLYHSLPLSLSAVLSSGAKITIFRRVTYACNVESCIFGRNATSR